MIPEDQTPEHDPMRSDLSGAHAYGDQTGSDHDQTGSDRDQAAADRDQAASDQDQAASDHDLARGLGHDGYDNSRATRDRTTLTRQETSSERHHTAHARDATARERDQAAVLRDRAAEARDHQAGEVDAEVARSAAGLESGQPTSKAQLTLEAARDRQLSADHAPLSASQRGEAARDREKAAHDRLSAAQDRAHAATERQAAAVDEPVDPARRVPGLAAVQREIDRARRHKGLLVVAYVDCDRLQVTTDIDDHDVQDERVNQLVGVINADVGPDELIVRLGGNELLCALPGTRIDTVGRRVEELAEQLTANADASPVNIGLAELVEDDNATNLVERARTHANLLAATSEDRCRQP
jgi:GGDEF domain-containing protein